LGALFDWLDTTELKERLKERMRVKIKIRKK
jgi:hypothetical protein